MTTKLQPCRRCDKLPGTYPVYIPKPDFTPPVLMLVCEACFHEMLAYLAEFFAAAVTRERKARLERDKQAAIERQRRTVIMPLRGVVPTYPATPDERAEFMEDVRAQAAELPTEGVTYSTFPFTLDRVADDDEGSSE